MEYIDRFSPFLNTKEDSIDVWFPSIQQLSEAFVLRRNGASVGKFF